MLLKQLIEGKANEYLGKTHKTLGKSIIDYQIEKSIAQFKSEQ